jgi:transglutaminase-like putative cysteine protease
MINDKSTLHLFKVASSVLDYNHDSVHDAIEYFKSKNYGEIELVKEIYEFVRDEIRHSYDIKTEEVTCTASETLEKRHGTCYSKSHLFAAILRGLNIPSGFSYQLLLLDDNSQQKCIHALNTVYFSSLGKWIRLDARGNKEGVHSEFSIDKEKLSYQIREELGELEYKDNYPHPPLIILETLRKSNTITILDKNLPISLD